MCSRYNLTSPPEAVRAYFGYPDTPNFPARYNIDLHTSGGDIEVKSFPLTSVLKRHRALRLPIIRGVVALVESMAIGFKALGISANAQLPEEEEEISGGMWFGTVAPALARSRAQAEPRLPDAPVTMATRPASPYRLCRNVAVSITLPLSPRSGSIRVG